MLSRSLLALSVVGRVLATFDVRPTMTAALDDGAQAIVGFSPLVTTVPDSHPMRLFPRQSASSATEATVTGSGTGATPSSVCAYISGVQNSGLACASSEFCGARSDLGVVGCCQSSSSLPGGGFTLQTCVLRTICYDSTAAASCTGTCTADAARIAFCTDPARPFCVKYTVTDAGLSSYRCTGASAGITITAVYRATTSAAGPSVSPTSQSSPTTPGTGSTGGTGTLAASPTETVYANGGGGNNTGAIVGGVVGGLAVILLAAGLGGWLWLKHRKQKRLETAEKAAAGAAAAGGAGAAINSGVNSPGAYGANNYNNTHEYYKSPDAGGPGPSNGHGHPDAPPHYGSPNSIPNGQYPFPLTLPNRGGVSYQNSPVGTPHGPPSVGPAVEVEGDKPSHLARASTASPSVLSSEQHARSDGNRSELEGPISNMAVVSPATMTALPNSPVSQVASPGTVSPGTPGPHMGHTSGNPSEWSQYKNELP